MSTLIPNNLCDNNIALPYQRMKKIVKTMNLTVPETHSSDY